MATVKFSSEVERQIGRKAKLMGRSKAGLIRELITDFVAEESNKEKEANYFSPVFGTFDLDDPELSEREMKKTFSQI
jgi:hypothetical protein